MTKNTKGGKKHKQLKNSNSTQGIKHILLKDNSGYQYYAIVEKYYGHNADVKFIKQIYKELKEQNTADGLETNNDLATTTTVNKKNSNIYSKYTVEETLHSCKAIIRGSIAKKCRLAPGDIVLISTRDYDVKKVDVLYKYSEEEYKYMYHNKFLDDSFIKLVNSFNLSSASFKANNSALKHNVNVADLLVNTNDEDVVFDDINTLDDDDEIDMGSSDVDDI